MAGVAAVRVVVEGVVIAVRVASGACVGVDADLIVVACVTVEAGETVAAMAGIGVGTLIFMIGVVSVCRTGAAAKVKGALICCSMVAIEARLEGDTSENSTGLSVSWSERCAVAPACETGRVRSVQRRRRRSAARAC
jgi:hypothetical protein